MILPVAIFIAAYAIIAVGRLSWMPIGRPAGALLGAVAMVATGVLTPEQSFHAIDDSTIVLLFAMMLLTAYLEGAGLFTRLAAWLIKSAGSPKRLLIVISLVSAALSAVLVNDTVCVFFTPVVVLLCTQSQLPIGPYLIALATSSNIGCAATLVGNPQNMIVGSMSHISFVKFFAYSGPAAAAALAANIALLLLFYGKSLPKSFASLPPPAENNVSSLELRLTLLVCFGVMIGFLVGFHLGYTALTGVGLLMLAHGREPEHAFERVDWTLLVFFCGLFVLVAGLAHTGVVDRVWAWAPHGVASFAAIVTVGSNLVSNVPMVLLTGPQLPEKTEFYWVLLAFCSTVAGNLTLIGSAANVIVAERAKGAYVLGFREHLRFGFWSCLTSLAVGVPMIWLADRFLN